MAKDKKVEEKNAVAEQAVQTEKFDPYQIIKAPLATEKCIRLIEFDNVLVFIVHTRSTKRDVKKAVEELFKVKVRSVNIQNAVSGDKKAYVRLDSNYSASDVSADLGFI
jgi:large subunit ribosomal protein L23